MRLSVLSNYFANSISNGEENNVKPETVFIAGVLLST